MLYLCTFKTLYRDSHPLSTKAKAFKKYKSYMVSVDGLTVEFGGTTLFKDISFVINDKDRIDYLLYKGKNARVTDCRIFGPEGCIAYSRRCPNPTRENFIKPLGVWPTDHKGVWMKLEVK